MSHGGFNVARKSAGMLVEHVFSACLTVIGTWKTYILASANLLWHVISEDATVWFNVLVTWWNWLRSSLFAYNKQENYTRNLLSTMDIIWSQFTAAGWSVLARWSLLPINLLLSLLGPLLSYMKVNQFISWVQSFSEIYSQNTFCLSTGRPSCLSPQM